MDITNPKRVLLRLGRLEVFDKPDPFLITTNMPSDEIFWMDVSIGNIYGPFPSIFDATAHYTWFVNTSKRPDGVEKAPGLVVHVDFRTKKRINYQLPE